MKNVLKNKKKYCIKLDKKYLENRNNYIKKDLINQKVRKNIQKNVSS